ncbi:hypothetical protein L202_02658 [Cryptococcus amylolentus CBS 6039]|uniref:Uncharacterized protein n=1 Tax=Cryptococcus amylolentus CBS 6039 TaxID=1295533 RepID=A0A1E3HVR6_9TREE|nr:hypothetical protein L202_02658 [Cryptococcus amylolentus CBS 6039]ODN80407.1 hypothetical protein L202_02658 [Cryptococcus amylolentus CBS 6039]
MPSYHTTPRETRESRAARAPRAAREAAEEEEQDPCEYVQFHKGANARPDLPHLLYDVPAIGDDPPPYLHAVYAPELSVGRIEGGGRRGEGRMGGVMRRGKGGRGAAVLRGLGRHTVLRDLIPDQTAVYER